ncbi:response regulator transcription factor [Burkholderia sp. BE17]|uniref:response regulator transcription factor n=1 Tax=Burkholderia sp. BE17 TaxID=2656644 RepID=UPI00128B29F6|nr:response regulator transcription factor [Burkholderia sp. BE17]MPV71582.1 response regulator [Burkholderia sp. BE17]
MLIASLEGDSGQAKWIRELLEQDGYECRSYASGGGFLSDLRSVRFDLLLVEWKLTDISGLEVLLRMRGDLSSSIPVLFLTSRSSEEDVVAALRAGADDYLVKPYRSAELRARVAALLRRAYGQRQDDLPFSIGAFRIDPARCRIERNGRDAQLTAREYDLALFLFRNAGRTISRQQISQVIWGREPETMSRTIDTHISRLRAKLGLRPEYAVRICTVYGQGWRLEEVEALDGAPSSVVAV